MKQSHFERQLREASEAQNHPPAEGGWEQLRAHLQAPPQKRSPLWIFSRQRWTAAAAVLLLIAMGAYTFYAPPAKQPLTKKDPQLPRANKVPLPLFTDTIAVPATTNVNPQKPQKNGVQESYAAHTKATVIPEIRKPLQKADGPAAIAKEELPQTATPAENEPRRQHIELPLSTELYAGKRPSKTAFDISALYGFAGALNTQYRLSVEARHPLSKRFFVQAQLQASRIGVEARQDYAYQSVSIGGGGPDPAAGVPEPTPLTPTTQQTQAVYVGTLYNIGFSPGIGFQLLKSTSLTVGPDVQKPVSGAITLRNEDAFRNQITGTPLIEETRAAPALDFGLQSRLQVGLTPHFSVNLLFRQGFTNYGPAGNTQNSFAGMGISYRFK